MSSSISTTPAFSFPSTASATTLQLSRLITTPLTDSSSTYASVTKVCLHISQYVAVMMDGNSFVLHERLFIQDSYRVLTALMTCVREHEDRRCRIVVARCLATFAKAHYVRLRSFGYMDMCGNTGMNYVDKDTQQTDGDDDDGGGAVNICVSRSSLEDECSSSSALCLADSALSSQDEGVIASAFESLAILCVDTTSDELLNEIKQTSGCFEKSIGTRLEIDTVGSIEAEYDPSLDLQEQVLTALSTRIRKLFLLISLIKKSSHQARCIPFLALAIRFVQGGLHGEEISSIVEDVVYSILFRGMNHQTNMKLRHACAIGTIRIANACVGSSWIEPLCGSSCRVLLDDMPRSQSINLTYGAKTINSKNIELLEQRVNILSTALIAMRGVAMNGRSDILCNTLDKIYDLPAQVDSSDDSCLQWYPRVTLLREAALRIFADNWIPESYAQNRFELLQCVMSQDVFEAVLYNRNELDGVETSFSNRNIADEIVSVFCTCSSMTGVRLIHQNKERTIVGIEEWFRCSVYLLDAFVPCLEWIEDRTYIEKKNIYQVIGAAAALDSYLSLFVQCLSTVGLVLPLKEQVTLISPRRRHLSPTAKANMHPLSNCEWAQSDISELCDDLVKYCKRQRGTVVTRTRLLLILASSWAQRRLSLDKRSAEAAHEIKARGILHLIGEEMGILLKNQAVTTPEQLHLCQECLRTIEFIILSIFHPYRGKMNSLKDSSNFDDELNDFALLGLEILNNIETKYIIAVSMELLEEYNLLLERLKALIHDEVLSLNEKSLYTDFPLDQFPAFGRTVTTSSGGGSSLPIPVELFGKDKQVHELTNRNSDKQYHHQVSLRVHSDVLDSSIFWYKVRLQLQLSISRTFDSVNICTNSPTLTSKRNSVRLMKQKKRDDNSMNYKSVLSLWQDSLFRLSGSSDPLVLLAGYHYQGGKLFIAIKMFNETPVSIPKGCRLALFASPCHTKDDVLHAPSSTGDSIEPRSAIVKNTIESGDVSFRQICYDG